MKELLIFGVSGPLHQTKTSPFGGGPMFKQFLKEKEGQTTVEYLLIIAVVVVVISVLGNQLSKKLPGTIDEVFKGINIKIKKLMEQAGAGQ